MLLTYLPWILIGVAAALALITLLWLDLPLLRVGNRKKHDDSGDSPAAAPKVSVIVYSQIPEEVLMEYLDVLSEQDYPEYEVIVVCEATAENHEILAESCSRRYRNTYVTFIPPNSHNLSRRKLALTIGIKAAHGDIIVTTTANSIIPSSEWLSRLIAPFRGSDGEDIDVSLGYSHFDYARMKGWSKWYREFSSVLTDVQWIGYALVRKPYRGDGTNLAFRRNLFFEHKGYSQSMYLHSGDDDIFINEVATPDNTAMVLDPETILKVEWGDAAKRMWSMKKEQYDFTSHWLPRAPFLREGAVSVMQWAIMLLCVASGLIAFYYAMPETDPVIAAIPAMVAGALLLLFWLAEIIIYRRGASVMKATRLWWAVPLFRLIKPIYNFIFRLSNRRSKRRNFTWAR